MFDDLAVDVNYNSLSQNRQEGQTLLIKSLPKPLILIRNFPVFDEGIFALLNAVADLGYLIDILNISCCCGKRNIVKRLKKRQEERNIANPSTKAISTTAYAYLSASYERRKHINRPASCRDRSMQRQSSTIYSVSVAFIGVLKHYIIHKRQQNIRWSNQ